MHIFKTNSGRAAWAALASIVAVTIAAAPAWAEPAAADPPASQAGAVPRPASDPAATIGAFYKTLLAVMKDAARLGYDGRYKLLEPAIDRAYNIPFMTR